MCTKCATLIPDVEQQFNYTAPTRCPNPLVIALRKHNPVKLAGF